MPVTPFHFGPGALLKGLLPRSASFAAFAAAQVLIDVESGYHLVRGDWPVHRELHSLPLAALAGLASAIAVHVAGRSGHVARLWTLENEFGLAPALVGGLCGGLSHPILDGIMHADLLPFWPLSSANPFLDAIDLATLHLSCLASGLVGATLIALRTRRAPSDE